MASIIGNRIKVSIWGQSHGVAVGAVLDGLPAGEAIDTTALQAFVNRRSAGANPFSTPRKEADIVEILSGLSNGHTCGAPMSLVISNGNAHSGDYDSLKNTPRPSHADYTAQVKFKGFQDAAGGGHFSGRLTAPLCAAGGVALQILESRGIRVNAQICQIGQAQGEGLNEEMLAQMARAQAQGDSVGGIISCTATGVPAGWGDPMFDTLEGNLAKLLFGIPAIKGVEFGGGFALAGMVGSQANDPFYYEENNVRTRTNYSGGINGGISNGMPITLRVAVKPTPSIAMEQESVDLQKGTDTLIKVCGRHDVCLVPRAVVCVEAAVAIGLLDSMISC